MTTVARSMHRGGAINKYDTGGIFGSIVDLVKGVGGAIGELIDRIFIGPKGEVKIVDIPVEVPPRGYRKPSLQEAQEVITLFKDKLGPVYDEVSGAYLHPGSGRRVITKYPYGIPPDTTIYYNNYPYGEYEYNNNMYDTNRRLFDALNKQFENEPLQKSTTKAPVRKKTTRPTQSKLKSDTVKVKLVE